MKDYLLSFFVFVSIFISYNNIVSAYISCFLEIFSFFLTLAYVSGMVAVLIEPQFGPQMI